MRRCLITRQVHPKSALVRFVIDPDGVVTADIAGRLPGRGFWLLPQRSVLEKAAQTNVFAKASRRSTSIPDDLADRVIGLLRKHCLDLIGMARRAGAAVVGFENSCNWAKSGRAGVLVHARDGSPNGRRKLGSLGRDIPVVELFDSVELSSALGRENVVHVAVARGGFSARLLAEARRLGGADDVQETVERETDDI
jgi:hypothetical protein